MRRTIALSLLLGLGACTAVPADGTVISGLADPVSVPIVVQDFSLFSGDTVSVESLNPDGSWKLVGTTPVSDVVAFTAPGGLDDAHCANEPIQGWLAERKGTRSAPCLRRTPYK